MSRIRVLLGENIRTHYCFFEKTKRETGQSEEEFEYKRNRQELRVRDLQRYGIQAVMLENYNQIPEILECIRLQAKTKNVFISGAAHRYEDSWGKKGIELITLLSEMLYDNDFRIITGHARGIGSFILSTILEKAQNSINSLDAHLMIRAFPYEDRDKPNYNSLKKAYRDKIADESGIFIFIFGNKQTENGECVLADGMREEYHAALAHNSYIIPVGSTGYIAREIFEEIYANRNEFQYLEASDFDILGKSTDPQTVVDQIRTIILRIKDGQ